MRTTTSQIVLLGLIFLCIPGMFNAVTSMAGGVDDPSVASPAAASLYICFALFSLLAPVPTNVLGIRITMVLGSCGYIVYVVALLAFREDIIGGSVVIASAAINGVGAALFQTAGGTLLFALPTEETRGFHLSLWMVLFSFGPVAGGALSFALNYESVASAATPGTYVAFLGLMVGGTALIGLLSPLERVLRPDGTRAKLPPERPSVSSELLALCHLFLDWRMLCLAPYFIASNWFYAYQFTCFNARLFDTRTQGLNNAVYWMTQMVGSLGIGKLLDAPCIRSRGAIRLQAVFASISALAAGSWVLGYWAGEAYGIDAPRNASAAPGLDFNSSGWPWLLSLYALWGFADSFVQLFSGWMLPFLNDSPQVLARFNGFYRCAYSLGAAASWGLSTASWGCEGTCGGAVPPSAQAVVNLALVLASLPGTICLLSRSGAFGAVPVASGTANDQPPRVEGSNLFGVLRTRPDRSPLLHGATTIASATDPHGSE
jgi:hypothetical protein